MENESKQRAEALRGRPKKEKEKLTTSINLKLSKEDFDSVKEKAKILGLKATQYVREMTLKGGIKSRFTIGGFYKLVL